MSTRVIHLASLLLAACATTTALAQASIPYTQDFESSVGSEWSDTRTLAVTGYGQALGQFDNTGSTLTLTTTASEQYTVIFDLWAFDSWDGDGRSCCGPDIFRVLVNGVQQYSTSPAIFVNFGSTIPEIPQTFLTNTAVGGTTSLGWGDKLYRRIAINFTASSATSTIEFDANNLSGGTDETWAIDNVRVVTTSNAAALLPAFRGRSEVSGLALSNANTTNATTGNFWLDLNNDGSLESVQAGTSLTVRYEGSTFTGPSDIAMQAPLAVLDADNDGVLELWHRSSAGATQALTFTGTGTSATNTNRIGANTSVFSLVSVLRAVAPLDANADGRIDLALLGTGGNALAINRGTQSNGSLSAFTRADLPSDAADIGSGAWIATGDINNDTIPDIFWSNGTGRLWVSDGAGGYAAASRNISAMNSTSNPAGAVFADIDNDADLDLFIGRRGSGLAPTLWINNGSTFSEQASSRGLGTLTNIVDGVFGDYDNDGDLDLFSISASGFSSIARNQGSSGGYNFTLIDDGAITESRGGDGSLADVDGDGDLDYSFTSELGGTVLSRHWLNTLNNGNQAFTVRVVGKGAGYINTAGIGTRVELWNGANTQFLQRRDIGLAKGAGGMTPLWVHFGGVNENTPYTLRIWGRGTVYSVPVTPATASTTFSSGTLQRFYTFDENDHAPNIVVTEYREVMQGE